MFLDLQEVMFRLRTMGPVHIQQAKEHRVVKVGRATCINASKGKGNSTEHVSRLQQEVGKDENGEESRFSRRYLYIHIHSKIIHNS